MAVMHKGIRRRSVRVEGRKVGLERVLRRKQRVLWWWVGVGSSAVILDMRCLLCSTDDCCYCVTHGQSVTAGHRFSRIGWEA